MSSQGHIAFPPSTSEPDTFNFAFRFASLKQLDTFWISDSYKRLREDLDELVSEPSRFEQQMGIEQWFVQPGVAPKDRAKGRRAIKDSIRPGGVVIVEAFFPKHLELGSMFGPMSKDPLYTAKELKEVFGDFDLQILREERIALKEGRHEGKGTVVGLRSTIPRPPRISVDRDWRLARKSETFRCGQPPPGP